MFDPCITHQSQTPPPGGVFLFGADRRNAPTSGPATGDAAGLYWFKYNARMDLPVSLQAGLWGLLAGGALVIGAAVAWFVHVPQRLIAAVTAFGAGVLISALAFELMDDAYQRGGFDSTAAGFLGGAVVYTLANWLLAHHGAKHRKRSQGQQPSEQEDPGSGMAIAVGELEHGVAGVQAHACGRRRILRAVHGGPQCAR